jgi:hypothetical protein
MRPNSPDYLSKVLTNLGNLSLFSKKEPGGQGMGIWTLTGSSESSHPRLAALKNHRPVLTFFIWGFSKLKKPQTRFVEYLEERLLSIRTHRAFWEMEYPHLQAFHFPKCPCIVFFPLVIASPYSNKACGLQLYPIQNNLVKELNLNPSGFLAGSFMKSDNFSSNILKTWNPRFITL